MVLNACHLSFFQFYFFIEGTSDATDASDTEQRLKVLEHELRRRKTELQKLRKKKERESLRKKEEHLKNELQVSQL